MRIVLISGSHRQASQSERVTNYLAQRLSVIGTGMTTDIISLAGNPLPLWDESAWQKGGALQMQWATYGERLKAADGFIVVSPEWHGMVPAGLKNFLLFAHAREVGHKPALIVTVSASRGGSYPVNELRASGYKNTRLCFIPEHLIVHDVEKMFVGDQPADEKDDYIRARADFALKCLLRYAHALKPVWEDGALLDKNYPYGM